MWNWVEQIKKDKQNVHVMNKKQQTKRSEDKTANRNVQVIAGMLFEKWKTTDSGRDVKTLRFMITLEKKHKFTEPV